MGEPAEAAPWCLRPGFGRTVERLRRLLSDPVTGHFARSVAWSGLAVAGERIIALLQAFFIARSLGIELFGKYGLVFTTIGLVSSLAGLQLGLTASVHVSRSGRADPRRAAAVMRLCEVVSGVLALACLGMIAVAPQAAARWLLGSAEHAEVVLAGGSIALFSIVGGVQEGILQGLERFAGLSAARLATTGAGLGLLLGFARPHDIGSVIAILAAAAALRAVVLVVMKEFAAYRLGLRTSLAGMWSAGGIIVSFSLPSVMVSLLSGFANWYGLYILTGAPSGFPQIAFLTTGQQWRGMVLTATAILASVAVPMMSRLSGTGDVKGVSRVHRLNGVANLAVAIAVVAVVLAASGHILAAYGAAFLEGRLVFVLTMLTTVPAVYVIVLQNYLVSHGRMWEQLWYVVGQSVVMLAVYWLAVTRFGALGFAMGTLVITVLTALGMHLRVASDIARAEAAPVGRQ